MDDRIRAAYADLLARVERAPRPRPREYMSTPLEEALSAWLNFLPLEPSPVVALGAFHRDDANRIRVMSRQLIGLSLAADLVRRSLSRELELAWSGDEVCLQFHWGDAPVAVALRPSVDAGAPLGFWPFDIRFANVDLFGRYVAPVLRGCEGSTQIQDALDGALARFYG